MNDRIWAMLALIVALQFLIIFKLSSEIPWAIGFIVFSGLGFYGAFIDARMWWKREKEPPSKGRLRPNTGQDGDD